MDQIKRALIMAAGIGERMRPVTLDTPKPLVSVHGVRFLDSEIAALHTVGIEDIVVVTGHLAEQFQDLETRYPGVRLVFNPDYNKGNNITSLYRARHYLDRAAVIMDGDILIRNPDVLRTEISRSGYSCPWADYDPGEWFFLCDDSLTITGAQTECKPGWELKSISFWTEADVLRLRHQLETVYESDNIRDNYWDYIPLIRHWGDYDLRVYPLQQTDILEIDSFRELCLEDPSYEHYLEKGDNET